MQCSRSQRRKKSCLVESSWLLLKMTSVLQDLDQVDLSAVPKV
jgi:hypothetical protein